MAYNTPELLLIGAAHNLVLGGPEEKSLPEQALDLDTFSYIEGPLDGNNW